MSETELSLSQHKQAVELHQKILISASLAQQNLWDMCSGLKQMRDGKLYKELGYANFEDYCENEVGMKRSNVYNYISIVERVKFENVQSIGQIGMTKLSLLATISEEQQAEVAQKVNLEETTVKELKEKINDLKKRNDHLMTKVDEAEKEVQNSRKSEAKACGRVSILETDNESYKKKIEQLEQKSKIDDAMKRSLQARLDDTGNAMRSAANEKKALEEENAELRNNIKELESRPVEVAVVDNSAENDRKLQEVIRSLERENMKRNEELEQQYREDEKTVRKMLEEDKQKALAELRDTYEKKLAELSETPKYEPVDESKVKFKVYLTAAFDALKRLTDFAAERTENIYKEKTKQLLTSVLSGLEE